jgi:hypothetical protein
MMTHCWEQRADRRPTFEQIVRGMGRAGFIDGSIDKHRVLAYQRRVLPADFHLKEPVVAPVPPLMRVPPLVPDKTLLERPKAFVDARDASVFEHAKRPRTGQAVAKGLTKAAEYLLRAAQAGDISSISLAPLSMRRFLLSLLFLILVCSLIAIMLVLETIETSSRVPTRDTFQTAIQEGKPRPPGEQRWVRFQLFDRIWRVSIPKRAPIRAIENELIRHGIQIPCSLTVDGHPVTAGNVTDDSLIKISLPEKILITVSNGTIVERIEVSRDDPIRDIHQHLQGDVRGPYVLRIGEQIATKEMIFGPVTVTVDK